METLTLELHDELKSAPREAEPEQEEPRYCSICDGIGHGYPGAGPCPTENTMSAEDVEHEDEEYRRDLYNRGL